MANLIKMAEVKLDIANLMGKRVLPQGDTSDWERFAQEAFDYAWRYYPWGFSKKTTTVLASDHLLPEDVDLDGYSSIPSSDNATFERVDPETYVLHSGDAYKYSMQFDATTGRYTLLSANTNNLDMVYQTAPPTLNDDPGVPFWSSMTIAMGAIIWAKMAENPTRADVTQEWDAFHSLLQNHVATSRRNQPKTPRANYQSRYGAYTGRVN